ncbi:hypothetical protein B0O99DRAFT_629509 [Bisporella sp. PMI_857]|nr:hypothetical protein B0O99DRAFT_629509 [Bisporella sp. PMI_857]
MLCQVRSKSRDTSHEFSFTALDGKGKWTDTNSPKFLRYIECRLTSPRICWAIDALPSDIDLRSRSRLSQGLESHHLSGVSRDT